MNDVSICFFVKFKIILQQSFYSYARMSVIVGSWITLASTFLLEKIKSMIDVLSFVILVYQHIVSFPVLHCRLQLSCIKEIYHKIIHYDTFSF